MDSNRPLVLNNLLHVSSITKNLISVSQFVKDNDVFFEFHPLICYVKDGRTGQTLLQGLLHKDLYRFNITSLIVVPQRMCHHLVLLKCWVLSPLYHHQFIHFLVSHQVDICHKRLGHPNVYVVKTVLQQYKYPTLNTNKLQFLWCLCLCFG